ncbi:MAG: Stk1 family PASTA domain-containing Ser/Thr kinase [Acidimicrobiia bacterium]
MPDQTSRVFNGRYELHRLLGRGGMAEVYLARDQLLDRPVAVKVLFPEHARDPNFVERFRREAQAAANLNHPNIVGVFDWGQSDGTYFIVMEYVDGRSLAEILRTEGPLHPDRAADVIADVAAALGFAHRNGVVHRDVKPGNVLVTPSGQVKVADFGIARAIESHPEDNLTQAGTVMGTATYFSPEQARGSSVDPRSDIYSLGCVLYELLLGRPPFTGDSPVAIAYKHVQEAPTPPRQLSPAVPPAMEAIVLKCLAKNPVNRYPSAEDLRADLRRYREGSRILAEPVMPPPVDPGATGVIAATTAGPAYTSAYPAAADDERYYDDEDDEPERRSSPWFVVALVLLLGVLGVLLFFLARSLGIFDDDEEPVVQVDVPSVVGKPVDEARAELQDLGLEVRTEFAENDDQPENTVFAQDPVGGTKVDEGTTVVLQVSSGASAVPVPGVVGQQFDAAKALLEGQGFVVQREDLADEDAPVGEVTAQDPPAGQDVPRGTTIVLTASSGPADRAVPDVSNRSVAEASNLLGAAGFTVGGTTEQASASVPEGRVISTNPTAGTVAAKGAAVSLVVSSGPPPPTVPSVVGLTQANATSQLEALGFEVDVDEIPVDQPAQIGRVQSQSPAANTTAAPGSTVTIVIGRAPEPPPDGGDGDGEGDGGD